VELRFGPLPNAAPPPTGADAIQADLAAARGRYVEGDFGGCLEALGDGERVHALLAVGERAAPARLLTWRVACLLALPDRPEAERVAL